ncbi:AAA domain-containing protein [Mucilaginibacter oryzae]|uniref:AAA domain-containing protein n=1 Tax=Mucilaginibacter oryzae TaxID=468058 RepID=A0A316H7Z8_9SPHI|nr:AAA domain-containing protein [Mucilaginibacter oryzae]PWK77279.1 AAA domain-containing protein [Mucilaginibacter oryzae]
MSKNPQLNMLRYWRNTLADAARVVIEVDKTLNQRNAKIDIAMGVVDLKQTLVLLDAFEKRMNEDKGRLDLKDPAWEKVEEAPVFIAPFRVSPLPEYAKLTGETGIFFPFWIRALLTRQGQLKPDEDTFPYIPRAYLEPQVNQEVNFVFSDVDRVDEAFGRPFNGQPGWKNYLDYILSMFKAITSQEPDTYSPENFAVTMEYTLVINDTLTGPADGIIGLYDAIIQQKKIPSTLNALAERQEIPLKPLLSGSVFEKGAAAHLGQMAYEFPLSKSQRTSLYHYATLGHGDILAINGPPGTGKTTLLQSVVATEVVKKAIAGGDPPVILACSANNQAVTNIIDSFSNVKQKKGVLYERWLPDLGGFGLYLPGANREVQPHIPVIKRVQGRLSGAHTEKENESYLIQAEAYFIARSGHPGSTVKTIIHNLQQQLKAGHQLLTAGINSWQSYQQLTAQLPELSSHSLSELEQAIKELEISFSNYLDAESIWLKLFSFLNFVKEKRATRAKQLFRDCPTDYSKVDFYQVRSIQQFFDQKIGLIEQLKKVQKNWQDWQRKANVKHEPDEPAFYEQLEMGLKYDLFYTAVHYWEGRWLIATRSALQEDRLSRNGEGAAKERWQRFAMLTPCLVSTFYMAPRFFSYSKFIQVAPGQNTWETPPLLDFIDLLIVDEAGQVSPEIGAASFALAKKALVVGDILQIEPVWNVPKKVDQANLHRYGVINNLNDQAAIEDLYGKGFLCSSGSIMRLAQKTSYYHLYPKQARGMLLTEHRRCFDEIISYCNNLAYDGLLEPMKGPAKGGLLPPLQFVSVKGDSRTSGTSRANQEEAQAIAQWIAAHQEALIKHYHIPLKDILAIVTPFTGQKFTLRNTLRKAGINMSGLTIGTVHALQGAERPVVLFSATYGANDQAKSYFFDAGPNMLNVAVSRAKETFILFGAPEIFRRSGQSPSMQLFRHISTSHQ